MVLLGVWVVASIVVLSLMVVLCVEVVIVEPCKCMGCELNRTSTLQETI
jgi:hypothetical protein